MVLEDGGLPLPGRRRLPAGDIFWFGFFGCGGLNTERLVNSFALEKVDLSTRYLEPLSTRSGETIIWPEVRTIS